MSIRTFIKISCLSLLLCLPTISIWAQRNRTQTFTISGYIIDEQSKETLLGASVYDATTMKGSVTNNYGYYTLVLSSGWIEFHASYVGYAQYESKFELKTDTVINISLTTNIQLNEVTVIGKAIESNVTGTQMSTIDIPIKQIKKIPAIFGETDIIKSLQLLPGVQSGTEGTAGLYVRGGGPDENLILLDGVPLYNVNHAMDFFSAFNTDAIKNVTLFKGNFPARFGGRLSSVVDVHTKDGDINPQKEYFNLIPIKGFSTMNNYSQLYSTDPVFNDFDLTSLVNNEYHGKTDYNVFSDDLFQGDSYTIDFYDNYVYFGDYDNTFSIHLHYIDKNYYEYLKSYDNYTANDLGVLTYLITEPVQIYSNIEGGIGIVGAMGRATNSEIKFHIQ